MNPATVDAWLQLSLTMRYEPTLVGKTAPRQFASESHPLLHIYWSHGCGDASPSVKQHGALPAGLVLCDFSSSKAGVVTITLPRARASLRDTGPLAAVVAGLEQPQVIIERLPAALSVCVQAYCVTFTETGERCQTRVGAGRITARALLDATTTSQPVEVELIQNTSDEVDLDTQAGLLLKGRLWIDSVSPTSSSSLSPATLFDTNVSVDDLDQQAAGHRTLALRSVHRMLRLFFSADDVAASNSGLPACLTHGAEAVARAPLGSRPPLFPVATVPWARSMHCPEWRTPFGSVGGSCYALHQAREPGRLDFYTTVFRTVCRRLGVPPRALATLATRGLAERRVTKLLGPLRAMTLSLTLFATTLVYLDDFVRTGQHNNNNKDDYQASEDYKDARVSLGDDCEGVSQEAFQEACDLLERLDLTDASLPLTTPNDDGILDWLRVAQRLMRLYVPLLVLSVVTNKKMSHVVAEVATTTAASSSQAANGIMPLAHDAAMAHTFMMLVPAWKLHHTVLQTDELLAARPSSSAKSRQALPRITRAVCDEARRALQRLQESDSTTTDWHNELPTLVGEGTAFTEPIVRPLDGYFPQLGDAAMRRLQARQHLMSALTHLGVMSSQAIGTFVTHVVQAGPAGEARFAAGREATTGFYQMPISAYARCYASQAVLDLLFVVHQDVHLATRTVAEHAADWTYGVPFYRLNYWPAVSASPTFGVYPVSAFEDPAMAGVKPTPTTTTTTSYSSEARAEMHAADAILLLQEPLPPLRPPPVIERLAFVKSVAPPPPPTTIHADDSSSDGDSDDDGADARVRADVDSDPDDDTADGRRILRAAQRLLHQPVATDADLYAGYEADMARYGPEVAAVMPRARLTLIVRGRDLNDRTLRRQISRCIARLVDDEDDKAATPTGPVALITLSVSSTDATTRDYPVSILRSHGALALSEVVAPSAHRADAVSLTDLHIDFSDDAALLTSSTDSL